jgi:hypothetical protein
MVFFLLKKLYNEFVFALFGITPFLFNITLFFDRIPFFDRININFNFHNLQILLYIKRARIVSFFCRKLFSASSSLRGAQRRSNPESRGFLDCFVATLLAMTTRRGLLRLPAGRLVAYPTHKNRPREE